MKVRILRLLCFFLCTVIGGASAADAAEGKLASMSLEQKVCQLFFVTPESFSQLASVTEPSEKLRAALQAYPVGGLVFFGRNFKSVAQTKRLTSALQTYATNGVGFFLGTDEEGGDVSRAINTLSLDKAPSMSVLGETGDPEQARQAAQSIGEQLAMLGLNLDFAPVADVRTDLDATEIRSRSFGYDAEAVASMVAAYVQGLTGCGVIATLKHFPGHGSTSGNSHNGSAISTRTVAQWRACDWLPFRSGLDAGAEVVLMSHLTAAVVDNATPASLSHRIVTELLRGELGFEGVIITDALRMDAVADEYSSAEACVRALNAGVDMLLLPKNFANAYEGVLAALADGTLTEARIDESVLRILRLKAQHGLLSE